MTLREFIIEEARLLIDDDSYYGSKEQIKAEKIISIFAFKDLAIEMEEKECLEEFYFRIIKTLSNP